MGQAMTQLLIDDMIELHAGWHVYLDGFLFDRTCLDLTVDCECTS